MVTAQPCLERCYWSNPLPARTYYGLIRFRFRFPDSISSRPAILDAIYAFDVEALRRELAAGVDPNVLNPLGRFPAVVYAVLFRAARHPEERIQERLACISVLLEAGASSRFGPNVRGNEQPLHCIAHNRSPAYQAVIALLLEAGADVNAALLSTGHLRVSKGSSEWYGRHRQMSHLGGRCGFRRSPESSD